MQPPGVTDHQQGVTEAGSHALHALPSSLPPPPSPQVQVVGDNLRTARVPLAVAYVDDAAQVRGSQPPDYSSALASV